MAYGEIAAAWVQAVGALIAIAATWLIANRQTKNHFAREVAADRAKIAASLAILGACDECLDKAATKIRNGKKEETRSRGFTKVNIEATADDFGACIERLASIPIFDLPDAKLVQVIVHARLLMDTGKRRVSMIRVQLETDETPNKNFAELLQQLRKCIDHAGHEVDQPRKTFGKSRD
jgi:hypothetical protein